MSGASTGEMKTNRTSEQKIDKFDFCHLQNDSPVCALKCREGEFQKAEAGQYEAFLVSFDVNCSRCRPHFNSILPTKMGSMISGRPDHMEDGSIS